MCTHLVVCVRFLLVKPLTHSPGALSPSPPPKKNAMPRHAPPPQVACMIIAASQRLDQLWNKCTPVMVFNWLSKASLSITDKIELLKSVWFHVHVQHNEDGNGLDSAKYVVQGLPREVADFVYMCMEGKEGAATMPEYFHMLEVCKTMFGVNDDNYYTVSSAVAGIMMGT